MMELGLAGKVAVVTGGSEGMGRAAARKLAEEGAKVAICARRPDVLGSAASMIEEATGQQVLAVPADVSDHGAIKGLIARVQAELGDIEILVNNAGVSQAMSLEKTDDAIWQNDIDLKLMAAVRLCQAVIPGMRERRDGRIINVTNTGGKAARPEGIPTSVTRAAGLNLTKALAGEYAADNIRVNSICVGLVKSGQWERRAAADGTALGRYYEEVGKRVPLGRVGEAGEFADLVAFLVSDRAAYITGTAINFDGGMCPVL